MSVFKIYKTHFKSGNVEGLIIEEESPNVWSVWNFWWPGTDHFHLHGHKLCIDLVSYKTRLPVPKTEFSGAPITLVCEGKSMDEVLDKFLISHFELFL